MQIYFFVFVLFQLVASNFRLPWFNNHSQFFPSFYIYSLFLCFNLFFYYIIWMLTTNSNRIANNKSNFLGNLSASVWSRRNQEISTIWISLYQTILDKKEICYVRRKRKNEPVSSWLPRISNYIGIHFERTILSFELPWILEKKNLNS